MRTGVRIWLVIWLGKTKSFQIRWGEITQRGTKPNGVVKGLDVIKEHGLSMLEVGGFLVVEALGLKGGREAFHHGVIITASLPAHAGDDVVEVQKLTEGALGILDSAIRMMDSRRHRPEFNRTLESLLDKRNGQGTRQFPAGNTFGTKIQFSGQIKPAILLGRQISQISTPDLVSWFGALGGSGNWLRRLGAMACW
jgi:hypothetical protein